MCIAIYSSHSWAYRYIIFINVNTYLSINCTHRNTCSIYLYANNNLGVGMVHSNRQFRCDHAVVNAQGNGIDVAGGHQE